MSGGTLRTFLRLLAMSVAYGVGFMFVKSLFPEPFILLILQETETAEGNLTVLASVYMASGLLGGVIGGLLIALWLFIRRGSGAFRESSYTEPPAASLGLALGVSLGFALLMGLISTFFILGAYATGVLPSGGVLDPLSLIRSSNFAPGTPVLVAWTFARELLPAGLAGLFLAPLGGSFLLRLFYGNRPPARKPADEAYPYEEY